MMVFMVAATWADRIKSDPDYHTDGTHNGNRPPNDPTAGQNIGFDDLARHKYWQGRKTKRLIRVENPASLTCRWLFLAFNHMPSSCR